MVKREAKMRTYYGVPRGKTATRRAVERLLPLFHIHLRKPDGLEEDELGIEFPDLERAYLETYRAIPETVIDLMRQGVGSRGHAFVIADASGVILMEVPLDEPLRTRRPGEPSERRSRAKRLSGEIAAEIARARETARQSREILARARSRLL